MFPDFDFACLCGLCKQLAINSLDKLNVRSPYLLSKINGNFPLTLMGQVLYNKFNATVCLKSLFPKDFHQNYYGRTLIQSLLFTVTFWFCKKKKNIQVKWLLKSAPRKIQRIVTWFGNLREIPSISFTLEMELTIADLPYYSRNFCSVCPLLHQGNT